MTSLIDTCLLPYPSPPLTTVCLAAARSSPLVPSLPDTHCPSISYRNLLLPYPLLLFPLSLLLPLSIYRNTAPSPPIPGYCSLLPINRLPHCRDPRPLHPQPISSIDTRVIGMGGAILPPLPTTPNGSRPSPYSSHTDMVHQVRQFFLFYP